MADGEPIELSLELSLIANINRYGVEAVMGRVLGHNELLCMNTAETIVSAYKERWKAEDWVKWGQDNPSAARLLNEAMRLANG